jgi:hypothetical protein
MRSTVREWLDPQSLQQAAKDFRFFLNRGYPRKAVLELVGNRYGLCSVQRHLLHRGVFSDADAKSRRIKIVPLDRMRNQNLAIDGYNVIITIEAGLSGRPLILGDDRFIRDISGLSGRFRKTAKTQEALSLIFNTLKKSTPLYSLFLFDAPISRSGLLAEEVRDRMKKEGLPGEAEAVKVPEELLNGFPGLVATSDTAVIDSCAKVVDLAGHILRKMKRITLVQWKTEKMKKRVLKNHFSLS